MADENLRWITVHPNGEENKGQHIPVKDGQTKKEAVKAFVAKHKNSNTNSKQRQIKQANDQTTAQLKASVTKTIGKTKPIVVDSMYTSDQSLKVRDFRDKFRTEKVENLLIFDDYGQHICNAVGTKDEVIIPKYAWTRLKGATFLHNHPQPHTILSSGDVWLLVSEGIRIIEAVGYDGWTHTLEILPTANKNKLYDFYNDYKKVVKNAKMKAYDAFKNARKTKMYYRGKPYDVPQNWTLYRNGATPKDTFNFNEYAKIVQNEVKNFLKNSEQKYGVKSQFIKE